MLFDSNSKQTISEPADALMSQPPSMYGTPSSAGKCITDTVCLLTHVLQCVGRGSAWILWHCFGLYTYRLKS